MIIIVVMYDSVHYDCIKLSIYDCRVSVVHGAQNDLVIIICIQSLLRYHNNCL